MFFARAALLALLAPLSVAQRGSEVAELLTSRSAFLFDSPGALLLSDLPHDDTLRDSERCTRKVPRGVGLDGRAPCSRARVAEMAWHLACEEASRGLLRDLLFRDPDSGLCASLALAAAGVALNTDVLESLGELLADGNQARRVAGSLVLGAACDAGDVGCVGMLSSAVDVMDISHRWAALFTARRVLRGEPSSGVSAAMVTRMGDLAYKPGTRWMALKSAALVEVGIEGQDAFFSSLVTGLDDHIGGFPSNALAALETLAASWATHGNARLADAVVRPLREGGTEFDRQLRWGPQFATEVVARVGRVEFVANCGADGRRDVLDAGISLLRSGGSVSDSVREGAMLALAAAAAVAPSQSPECEARRTTVVAKISSAIEEVLSEAEARVREARSDDDGIAATLAATAAKALHTLLGEASPRSPETLELTWAEISHDASANAALLVEARRGADPRLDQYLEMSFAVLGLVRVNAPVGDADALAVVEYMLTGVAAARELRQNGGADAADVDGADFNILRVQWLALLTLRWVAREGDSAVLRLATRMIARAPRSHQFDFQYRFFGLKALALMSVPGDAVSAQGFVAALRDFETCTRFDAALVHLPEVLAPTVPGDAAYDASLQGVMALLESHDSYERFAAVNAVRALVRCGHEGAVLRSALTALFEKVASHGGAAQADVLLALEQVSIERETQCVSSLPPRRPSALRPPVGVPDEL